jgi:hypothetical protein
MVEIVAVERRIRRAVIQARKSANLALAEAFSDTFADKYSGSLTAISMKWRFFTANLRSGRKFIRALTVRWAALYARLMEFPRERGIFQ